MLAGEICPLAILNRLPLLLISQESEFLYAYINIHRH
jgi:hypothetical protein